MPPLACMKESHTSFKFILTFLSPEKPVTVHQNAMHYWSQPVFIYLLLRRLPNNGINHWQKSQKSPPLNSVSRCNILSSHHVRESKLQ